MIEEIKINGITYIPNRESVKYGDCHFKGTYCIMTINSETCICLCNLFNGHPLKIKE